MTSFLTKRHLPIPDDVLDQLKQIAQVKRVPFNETHCITFERELLRQRHEWLSEMIDKGHRV